MNKRFSPPDNIYLVGFMGSGKSTVGRLLARRLGFKFADLDSVIEEESGKSIAEIFSLHGEDHFRRLETEALARLAADRKSVIALGGGAFVAHENREMLEKSGTSVWLKVSCEEAARRCRGDSQRPLAHDQTRFQKLHKIRQPVYEKADIHVETDGKEPDMVCDLILQKFSIFC